MKHYERFSLHMERRAATAMRLMPYCAGQPLRHRTNK